MLLVTLLCNSLRISSAPFKYTTETNNKAKIVHLFRNFHFVNKRSGSRETLLVREKEIFLVYRKFCHGLLLNASFNFLYDQSSDWWKIRKANFEDGWYLSKIVIKFPRRILTISWRFMEPFLQKSRTKYKITKLIKRGKLLDTLTYARIKCKTISIPTLKLSKWSETINLYFSTEIS